MPVALKIVSIEPSSRCNSDCLMCIIRERRREPGLMSEVVFRKVLADGMALSPRPRLYFGGTGEPLLHPDCVRWIGEASQQFETVLQTNAELLTPATAEALLKTGLKRLVLSLDGMTKETFEAIRPGLHFEKVWENINHFLSLPFSRTHLDRVYVQMINLPQNRHEQGFFVNTFTLRQSQWVVVFLKNPVSFAHYGPHYHWKHEDISVPARPGVMIDPCRLPVYKGDSCKDLFSMLSVMSDGRVAPCCLALDDDWALGRILDRSLKSLFFEDPLKTYRAWWRAGEFDKIPMCRDCMKWRTGKSPEAPAGKGCPSCK
jgi:radical SAM protein with 4Fe4S-binding SPASM domain